MPNFGIQEFTRFNQETLDVFPGCPELRDGMLWANDQPGWGIDIDESPREPILVPGPSL